jgi:hypothetical protein
MPSYFQEDGVCPTPPMLTVAELAAGSNWKLTGDS